MAPCPQSLDSRQTPERSTFVFEVRHCCHCDRHSEQHKGEGEHQYVWHARNAVKAIVGAMREVGVELDRATLHVNHRIFHMAEHGVDFLALADEQLMPHKDARRAPHFHPETPSGMGCKDLYPWQPNASVTAVYMAPDQIGIFEVSAFDARNGVSLPLFSKRRAHAFPDESCRSVLRSLVSFLACAAFLDKDWALLCRVTDYATAAGLMPPAPPLPPPKQSSRVSLLVADLPFSEVAVSMDVGNVSHALLRANRPVLDSFNAAVEGVISKAASDGSARKYAMLELTEASVFVRAEITLAEHADPNSISSRLEFSTKLRERVRASILRVDGISAVSVGVVDVGFVAVSMLDEKCPQARGPPQLDAALQQLRTRAAWSRKEACGRLEIRAATDSPARLGTVARMNFGMSLTSALADQQLDVSGVELDKVGHELRCTVGLRGDESLMRQVEILNAILQDEGKSRAIRAVFADSGMRAGAPPVAVPCWPLERVQGLVREEHGYELPLEALQRIVAVVAMSYWTYRASWEAVRAEEPEEAALLVQQRCLGRWGGQLMTVHEGLRSQLLEDPVLCEAALVEELLVEAPWAQGKLTDLMVPLADWVVESEFLSGGSAFVAPREGENCHHQTWYRGAGYWRQHDPGVRGGDWKRWVGELPAAGPVEVSRLRLVFQSVRSLRRMLADVLGGAGYTGFDVLWVDNLFRNIPCLGRREVSIGLVRSAGECRGGRVYVRELCLSLGGMLKVQTGRAQAYHKTVQTMLAGCGVRPADLDRVQAMVLGHLDLTERQCQREMIRDLRELVSRLRGHVVPGASITKSESSAVREILEEMSGQCSSVGLSEWKIKACASGADQAVARARLLATAGGRNEKELLAALEGGKRANLPDAELKEAQQEFGRRQRRVNAARAALGAATEAPGGDAAEDHGIEGLRAAIKEGTLAGLEERELWGPVQTLSRRTQVAEARSNLEAAVGGRDVDLLRGAIDAGRLAGLPEEELRSASKVLAEETQRAQSRRGSMPRGTAAGGWADLFGGGAGGRAGHEQRLAAARESLEGALASRRVRALKEAIQEGRDAGMSDDELEEPILALAEEVQQALAHVGLNEAPSDRRKDSEEDAAAQ